MATFDPEQQAIVVGIVYDGPPEAGKTTSMRALARSFGREVYTPEEEDGRTVYFDWLEHTGGRFDGGPIRCQIMSVPGQENRAHRRRHLLGRADVIVFVADTSSSGWPASRERLEQLLAWRNGLTGPPVGILLQANRRDAPSVISLEELKRTANSRRVALVESVAPEGVGVRESFVFAVRLALDRVRELQRIGDLPHCDRERTADHMFEELRRLDAGPAASPPRPSPEAVTTQARADRFGACPSDAVPSGWVWPPVDGRIVLREALSGLDRDELHDRVDRSRDLPTGFRLSTCPKALFNDAEQGRRALIAWARLHAGVRGILSNDRCIVLTETTSGHFRLWQIVRKEPSLRELFVGEGMFGDEPSRKRSRDVAERLLLEVSLRLRQENVLLECSFDSVGLSDSGGPRYVGDLPLPIELGSFSLELHGASK